MFLVIFGAGTCLVLSLLNDLATDLASEGNLGEVTSVYNTMKYVGQTASSLSLGIVLGVYGRPVVFYVSGSIGLFLVLTYSIISIDR